jgi:cytochrome P450
LHARFQLIRTLASIRAGWDWPLVIARSDDRWRRGRKLLDRGLGPGATASYRPMLQAGAHKLLSRLLASPRKWQAHIELSVEFLSSSFYVLKFV